MVYRELFFEEVDGPELAERRPKYMSRELDSVNKMEQNLIKWVSCNIIISFWSGSLHFRTAKL